MTHTHTYNIPQRVVRGCHVYLVAGAILTGCALTTDPCLTAACDPVASCVVEASTAVCTCAAGYNDVNDDGSSCQDWDECSGDNGGDDCDPLVTCINTAGSYECEPCPVGYHDLASDGTVCIDWDECAGENGGAGCDPLTCRNTAGAYACDPCPPGYNDVNGDGTSCVDWNECGGENGGSSCDPLACENTPGSYTCTSCPEGYLDIHGDETHCVKQVAVTVPYRMSSQLLAYIKNDGTHLLDATGTPCEGTESGKLGEACIHAGLMRTVATGLDSCAGLTATDSLNALQWECLLDAGLAVMVSTDFNPDKGMRDLIDFDSASFLEDSVDITKDGRLFGQTPLTQWWDNPIVVDTLGGPLATSDTIYLYRDLPAEFPEIAADRIAILVEEGYVMAKSPVNELSLDRITLGLARDYYYDADFGGDLQGPDFVVLRYDTGAGFVDAGPAQAVPESDMEQAVLDFDLGSMGPLTGMVTFRLYPYGGTGETFCLANAPEATTNFVGTGSNVELYGSTLNNPGPGALLLAYDVAGNSTTIGVRSLPVGATASDIDATALVFDSSLEKMAYDYHDGGSLCARDFPTGTAPQDPAYIEFQLTLAQPSVPSAPRMVTMHGNFGWFEGELDATRTDRGINLEDASFCVIRNASVSHADIHGIDMVDGKSNSVEGVRTYSNAAAGLSVHGGEHYRVHRYASFGDGLGLMVRGGTTSSLFNRIRTAGSRRDAIGGGISVSDSTKNVFVDWITSNSRFFGLDLQQRAHDNVFAGFASVNNSDTGVRSGIDFSPQNAGVVMLAGTVANNLYRGFDYLATDRLTQLDCLAANNGAVNSGSFAGDNLQIQYSADVVVNDFISSHAAGYDLATSISSDLALAGLFQVGNDGEGACFDEYPEFTTNPGFENGSCAIRGNSTADVSLNASLEDSFFGKVTTEDMTNQSDTDGTVAYSTDLDWFDFDNPMRAWGKDGANFPSADNQGWCNSGSCRIWDWSLSASDTQALNSHPDLPTGDDTIVHTWSDGSTIEFLDNAIEIIGDGVGNDNTLCESNETCLFLPNVGGYQGHGELVPAGDFVDGSLTGITLLRHANNGR